MSHGSDKRGRALAIQCANLYRDGHTHRTIAEVVGKRPEQIKALVKLGQRLLTINPADTTGAQK